MTCVNCSTAIENGMINEFKNKGLIKADEGQDGKVDASGDKYGVSVILLMHKMKISFYKKIAQANKIDEKTVIEEVEDIGFGAELLNIYELQIND